MKQLLSLVTAVLLCCFCNSVTAIAQTYQRNYSTHTEYGTVPQTTVPSANKPSYQPTYDYNKPEKEEKVESAEESARSNMANLYYEAVQRYNRTEYNEYISAARQIDPLVLSSGLRENYYKYLVNSYINLKRNKELVQHIISSKKGSIVFTDRGFSLLVADQLRGEKQYTEACTYFDMAKARGVYNEKYQLSYCLAVAKVAERETEAREAFEILIKNEPLEPLNYYNRGEFLLDRKDGSAINDLTYFISTSGNKYKAYFFRAKANFMMKNYKECIEDGKEYRKVYLNPECDELIAAATIEYEKQLKDPVFLAEQKRKAELALIAEQKRIADKKKYELQLAEEQKQREIALAELKKKTENDLAAFKIQKDEYRAYISKMGIEELIKKDDVITGKCTTYLDAIKQGDLLSVYILWKQGKDINKEYGYKEYALFNAINSYEFDIAQFLIISGFDLKKVKFSTGDTPLHLVCHTGYADSKNVGHSDVKTAKLLIDKGADINAVNQFGNTPLHYAASSGNLELAKLLLDNGAKTNIRNTDGGKKPLGMVPHYRKDEFIKLLKEY